MSFCPECGAEVAGEAFCGSCGAALRTARPGTGAAGPAAGAASSGGAGAVSSSPPAYPAASTATTTTASSPGRGGSKALPIGVGLIAAGLVGLGVWWFTGGPGGDTPTASSTSTTASSVVVPASPTATSAPAPVVPGSPGGVPSSGVATVTVVPSGPASSAAVNPSATTAAPAPVPSGTAAGPTAVTPSVPAAGPGARPGPASAPAGSWILVLDSLEQSKYTPAQAAARAAALPGSVVIDSSATPGLRPGYWAIVSSGHFSSKSAASASCSSFGRPVSGDCYPRRLG